MNFYYLFTFMLVYFSGVLSGVIHEIPNINESSYFAVPYSSKFKVYTGSSLRALNSQSLRNNYLVGSVCVLHDGEKCKAISSVIMKLNYNPSCNYSNSTIKKMAIYNRKGKQVHELINLTKLGKNEVCDRHIRFYFKNGCEFAATFNYKDTDADGTLKSLARQ